MSGPGVWWRTALARLQRARLARELDEEMAWHRDRLARDLRLTGLSATDARDAARRRFGNPTSFSEEAYEMWRLGLLDGLSQDIRHGFRALRRSPAFTGIAVAILALGIGGTTTMFSAVHALLLRPLPFAHPEQLMAVSLVTPGRDGGPPGDMVWSWPKYATFRDQQTAFRDLALYAADQATIGTTEPERLVGETVSARYLSTLGVRPALGRDFLPADDAAPNPPATVVLGDAFWQRQFNADPAILGRAITIDKAPYTVIGVLPAGFHGLTGRAEFLTPILARRADVFSEPFDHEFQMVARRRAGVSVERAIADVGVLGTRVDAAYRDRLASGFGARARVLDQVRVDPIVRRSLLVMMVAVGLVLLIACANIANLFLVRASVRQREIAIRLAIGAGRARLVRLFLTESVIVASLGGLASLLVAWGGVRWLGGIDPGEALRAQSLGGLGAVSFATIRLDPVAFGFAMLVALGTGVLFGLAPAVQATRPSVTRALSGGAAPASGGRPRGTRTRQALVVAEIALALVLLAGSGLMLRSLGRLLTVSPGVDPRSVLSLRLSLAGDLVRDSLPGFYDRLLARLRALPGVTDVALGDCPPLAGGCNATIIAFRDRPPAPRGTGPIVGVHWVTPSWFRTLGVTMLRGRGFTDGDRIGRPKVVLVNATAAQRFWPNEDPIGKRVGVSQGGFGDTATVVGVVSDVRFGTIDSLPMPDVFISYLQSPRARMMVFARTAGDPSVLVAPARAALGAVAPDVPPYDVRPLADRLSDATSRARLSALLLTMFAGVSLGLAALGIYGVMSFSVAQRTREIGIRVALGALRSDVVRLVIGQGLVLAAAGTAAGLAAAAATTRVLQSLLYDISPGDPVTFVAIVVLLGLAAFVASAIPALRATRIAPTDAMRAQ